MAEADVYDVYFATNRNFNGSTSEPKFGERFHADGPQYFRVGRAKVERKGADDYKYKSAQVEAEDPNKNILGSQSMFDELRKTLQTTKQDVIIFIHGFANTFENSVERAAQLHHEYRITPEPDPSGRPCDPYLPIVFAFLWPSNGRVFPKHEYQSDRDDAQVSGVAMARALLRLLQYLKELRDEEKQRRREKGLQTNEFLPDDERLDSSGRPQHGKLGSAPCDQSRCRRATDATAAAHLRTRFADGRRRGRRHVRISS